MPNKTISLSEALCDQLDRYATEHGLAVSQVAQQALEQFLHSPAPVPQPPAPPVTPAPQPPPPTPAWPQPQPQNELPVVRDYLTELACYVDNLRQYLAAHAAIFDQPPPPFPPPPWWSGLPK